MRKIISLTIVLLLTASAFAQKGTTSLGLTFSGDYTKVWRTGASGYEKMFYKVIDGKLGYTAGVNVSFQRREKRAFDIGLLYMQNKEGFDITSTYYSGYSYVVAAGESVAKNHLISIPLNWLFYFNQGKTRFYGSVGIAPTYYLARTDCYTGEYSDGNTESETSSYFIEPDWANLWIGGTVALGFSQYLSEHFELRVAPTYRFIASSEKVFPYFIGLNAGVYYKFNSKSPESRPH